MAGAPNVASKSVKGSAAGGACAVDRPLDGSSCGGKHRRPWTCKHTPPRSPAAGLGYLGEEVGVQRGVYGPGGCRAVAAQAPHGGLAHPVGPLGGEPDRRAHGLGPIALGRLHAATEGPVVLLWLAAERGESP